MSSTATSVLIRSPKVGLAALSLVAALSFDLANTPAQGEPKAEALVSQAHALYGEKKYDEAIARYTEALRLSPGDTQTLQFRGLAHSMKGDWKACVADLDKAVRLQPENLELLSIRAFSYLHTCQFDLALKDYQAMEDLEKGAGRKARNELAQQLLQRARGRSATDQPDDALADYDRVLALVPPNDILLYGRACELIELGRFEEALTELDKVISLDGDLSRFGDPHAKRAEVKKQLGDTEGATTDAREAQQRSSETP